MERYKATESNEIIPFPIKFDLNQIETLDETTTGDNIRDFFPIPDDNALIKPAWDTTYKTLNPEVAREARRLLSVINELIEIFPQLGVDLYLLPPIYSFNVDDGSVLIEWIFSDFRIGFNIEQIQSDSSWYIVSNKSLGDINASGYLNIKDSEALVLWILTFVFLHFLNNDI